MRVILLTEIFTTAHHGLGETIEVSDRVAKALLRANHAVEADGGDAVNTKRIEKPDVEEKKKPRRKK